MTDASEAKVERAADVLLSFLKTGGLTQTIAAVERS